MSRYNCSISRDATISLTESIAHSRAEGEGELRLARELLADEALPLHLGDAEALVHLGEDHLHHELVARDDGPAELDAVDAC